MFFLGFFKFFFMKIIQTRQTIIYLQKNSKVPMHTIKNIQKEIKSTLNQELMHILGERG